MRDANTSALAVIKNRNLPIADRVDATRKLMLANAAKISLGADKLLNPEKIIQVACLSFRKNPELLNCTIPSLFGALSEAATYGWICDGIMGQAYLMPFKKNKGKSNEVTEAVLVPGYKGLRDLVRRSGECDTVMESVHEGDEFRFNNPFGFPHHIRSQEPNRKFLPVTHVYVLGQFKSGAIKCFTMSVDECKAHRDHYSQGWKYAASQKNKPWLMEESPWNEKSPDFRVMCMKTVMLDAIHRGEFPMSVADMQVAKREETIAAVEASTIDLPQIDLLELDAIEEGEHSGIREDDVKQPAVTPPVEPQDEFDPSNEIANTVRQITDLAISGIEAARVPDNVNRKAEDAIAQLAELGASSELVDAARRVRLAQLQSKPNKQKTLE